MFSFLLLFLNFHGKFIVLANLDKFLLRYLNFSLLRNFAKFLLELYQPSILERTLLNI